MTSISRDFPDTVRESVPLGPSTWLKVGGPAQYFAEPRNVDELSGLVRRCKQEQIPVRVLGGGSNILVRDEGVSGMVLKLSAPCFGAIKPQPPAITAGGGAALSQVVSAAVRAGLGGLETLAGIPGSVGGALHGNAGSHGGDVGQWTCHAAVMTRSGEIIERQRDDLVFAYRQSSLNELVILSARFELEEDDPETLTKRMQKQWIVKNAAQPMAHEATGCIFKDSRGMSAAMLIEQAGLKGTQVGQAEVSQVHPNFIIAHPGATSQDVRELIEIMRNGVAERLGVELETEIEIW